MDALKRFKYPALILILLIVLMGCFFIGSKYALDHLVVRQVTPNQLANAMKDDHFWVSYREDTLLVSGKVMSVTHTGNDTIIGFKTDTSYGAQCNFTNAQEPVLVGQTIKILSIANTAERLQSGVQLNNCLRL